MNLSLNYYKTLLLSVKTQIVAGKRKMAKPILLLSIIQAIEKHSLIKNEIQYTDELEKIYVGLFQRYGEQFSPMKYPFFHLTSDGFYHIKGNLATKSPTPKQLKEKIEYAYLDEQLWNLLQDDGCRKEIRLAIEEYFQLSKQQ